MVHPSLTITVQTSKDLSDQCLISCIATLTVVMRNGVSNLFVEFASVAANDVQFFALMMDQICYHRSNWLEDMSTC